jgi:hypothetical protein
MKLGGIRGRTIDFIPIIIIIIRLAWVVEESEDGTYL